MSYRCSVCKTVVGPRLPLKKHIIYRNKREVSGDREWFRKEIAKELPVCDTCAPKLEAAQEKLQAVRYG